MSHSRDIDDTSNEDGSHLEYLTVQYFSVNFHFLESDKRYNRDFFTIYTIDDGLSFGGIQSILLSDNISLIPCTIFRKGVSVFKANWSNQRCRIFRDQSHLKEQIKMHRIAFSEFCRIEFFYRNILNNIWLFYRQNRFSNKSLFSVFLIFHNYKSGLLKK